METRSGKTPQYSSNISRVSGVSAEQTSRGKGPRCYLVGFCLTTAAMMRSLQMSGLSEIRGHQVGGVGGPLASKLQLRLHDFTTLAPADDG